jgi:hypothetical protein
MQSAQQRGRKIRHIGPGAVAIIAALSGLPSRWMMFPRAVITSLRCGTSNQPNFLYGLAARGWVIQSMSRRIGGG